MQGSTETPTPAPTGRPALASGVHPPDQPEHQELRDRHVGSSEAAALFNLSPHATRLELYLRKRGELPAPDLSGNEAVRWGQYLEPAIGQGVAERMGWTVRKVHRYVTHPQVEG